MKTSFFKKVVGPTILFSTLFLLNIPNLSAQKDYDLLWKEIDKLSEEGRTSTAIEKTNFIFNKAKKEKNDPQRIKALIVGNYFTGLKEEDSYVKALKRMEEELESSKEPARSILHSALGELYDSYLDFNRWEVMKRTPGGEIDEDDLETWTMKDLVDKANEHFDASLEKDDFLKNSRIEEFDVIWTKYEEGRKIKSSIYDLLASRALDHYKREFHNPYVSATPFQINKEIYLAERQEFVQHKLEGPDYPSYKFRSLQIYQDLLSFHMSKNDHTASIYYDLQRLAYVYDRYSGKDDWQRYEESLKRIISNDAANKMSSEAYFRLAFLYKNLGYKDDILHKWKYAEAVKKCDECIEKFPKTTAAKKCINLKNNLLEPEFRLILDEVNMTEKEISVQIIYKNVQSIHMRLVENNDQKFIKKASARKDESIQHFTSKPALQKWDVILPDSADYREHKIMMKLDGQSKGYYALLASKNSNFTSYQNILRYNLFWSSDLAYFFNQDEKEAGITVMNRQNGHPLKGATVELYREEYDYQQRGNNLILEKTLVTDKDGMVSLGDYFGKNKNLRGVIAFKGDTLVMDRSLYLRKSPRGDKKTYETSTFTDRKVYRPGQNIYFKTIVLEEEGTEISLAKGKKLDIKLMDANGQELNSLELKTNEFGSVTGVFTLPASVLTGWFTIHDGMKRHRVRVEEYKRPSFEVKIDKPEGSMILNKMVEMSGVAISYSGVPLSKAKVRYVVQRDFRYSYPYHYYYNSPKVVMDQGEIKTDENGKFTIEFEALADESIDKEDLPVFEFNVEVFVSDINGETQSSEQSVNIGYHSLEIYPRIGRIVNKDETKDFEVNTLNLSYQANPAKVEVYIMKLISPSDYLKKTNFQIPDYFFNEEEHDNYLKTLFDRDWPDFDWWDNGDTLKQEIINTEESGVVDLSGIENWESGVYRVFLRSVDAYGQDIFKEKEFVLFGRNDQNSPIPVSMWAHGPDKVGMVGESVDVLVASIHKDAMAYYVVSNKNGTKNKTWLELKGGMKKISIPVMEEDRGEIEVQVVLVYDGQDHFQSIEVEVPFDNKKLDVKLETHRNKLKPGDLETWKVDVSSKGGVKEISEVLVSMYDKSLDVIEANPWSFNPYYFVAHTPTWNFGSCFSSSQVSMVDYTIEYKREEVEQLMFDDLNWFGFSYWGTIEKRYASAMYTSGNVIEFDDVSMGAKLKAQGDEELLNAVEEAAPERPTADEEPQVRKNFKETAFYYPQLQTKEDGSLEFSFEVPDALTKWYFQSLAISEDLKFGLNSEEFVTQKELMVVSNYPRFVTAGDTLLFTSKISNLTDKEMNANVSIRINDAVNGKALNIIRSKQPTKKLNINARGSSSVQWSIICPDIPGLIEISVFAETAKHRDGESKSIPVLSRSIMVTETYPISLRGGQEKSVSVKNLGSDMKKKGIDPHRFTLEFTPNPVWNVVQALPYLDEKVDECTDQKFNRFYANSIGLNIINSNPKIEQVFEAWKAAGDEAFKSNLEKNQELKNIVLAESPWLNDAIKEEEDKRKVALFFDENNLKNSLSTSLFELVNLQRPNGGWPWFKGMEDSPFVTQNIVQGMGRLRNLGIQNIEKNSNVWTAIENGVYYLDARMHELYKEVISKDLEKEKRQPSSLQIHYLLTRSYFTDIPMNDEHKVAFNYFLEQSKKFWLQQGKYQQAMIAITSARYGDKELPKKILLSIEENAIQSDEFGMYWKEISGMYWHQSGIARQAMIIEAFDELDYKEELIDEMKIWLLKQKQTHSWNSGKSTTEACYAMLLRGGDLLSKSNQIEVEIGKEHFVIPSESGSEAGSSYTKMTWTKNEILPEMKDVQASNKGESVGWGAVYYQYFQNSDQIESSGNGMSIQREYYLKKYNESGAVLESLKTGSHIRTGDVVIVKMIIKTDRDLEFVHLKDMRAAGLEPIQVKSGYNWRSSTGYYLSIRDASTNYYFDFLPRGSHVLEFEMKANNEGNFTTGIGTVQSFYAPEFSAHSRGIRIAVNN